MEEVEDPIVLVHETISPKMAEQFGVVPLSKRLAGASEIGYIRQTGQSEPLTIRLANILRDGYQPESIPKEMIQNAEDAGASEMKFLLDLRTNNSTMEKLLDPEMKEIQGPALWVYNDGVFSDKDLENITKLGGATKRDDCSKIGQFGLGFNSVYHITDVPSFVTKNVITFFDPHRSHLRRHIRGEGTGIQLNFLSNPSKIQRFRDQFAPYDGLFDCNILGVVSGPDTFNGTLFRLPLRSKTEARKSEICDVNYDETKMKPLIKSLCESASEMLLFTENVRVISVYLFGADAAQPSLLFTISRKVEHQNAETVSFKTAIVESITKKNDIPPDQVTTMTFSSSWTKMGAAYFHLPAPTTKENTWITVSSMGKGKTRNLCSTDIGKTSGLLPCGGVAWCLTSETIGKIFSFLPLSVPESGLPVSVNGAFAVSSDRRGIWKEADCANMTPYAALKSKWNDALCEDAIVCAYVTLLQIIMVKDNIIRKDDVFALWPNPRNTGRNTDCGKVMTGFYDAVASGMGGEDPPSVFGNTDQLLPITDVAFGDEIVQKEETMFNSFKKVMKKITSRTAVRIPMWVVEGFKQAQCEPILRKHTYSWESFFQDIFLPNFHMLEAETIKDMMTFALFLRDKGVHELMQESECIPNVCENKITYKKPFDLLDPDIFRNIFSDQDGVFPEPSFLLGLDKGQIDTLRDIGCMQKDIGWPTVIERARTVQGIWDINKPEAKKRIKAILAFLDFKTTTTGNITEDFRVDLKSVVFLPAVRGDEDECIQCAELVYPPDKKNVIGRVRYIVNEDLSLSVKRLLEIEGKDVTPEDFFENVDRIKRSCDKPIPETVRDQWDSVYKYLESHTADSKVLEFLQTGKYFLVEQTFVEAGKLAKRSDSIPPYLYQVPNDLLKFNKLLNSSGVADEFGYKEFVNVLESIHEDRAGKPLEETTLKTVLAKIIKPLFDIADEIPNEIIPNIPIPDSNNVLRRSENLSFCDLEQFQHLTKRYKLCHNEIPLPHAKRLGVRDIRDQMLKEYSQPLPGLSNSLGEDFGQREQLVTRIKRIMEGYPCDFSILKEIVQNADDAKATKVHFVLDCRMHPTERLFYDTMRELQGPALLAYNDSSFSDDDIRGIQKLGEGSKGDDSDKTGRYGVGFNVVYHLTDCPMFMSEEDTLCIFDPTLKYVKDASITSPGRMFRPINEEMLQSYADIFECFLSFKTTFSLKCGSLFRFALRTHDSELGSKISVRDIKGLFENFKEEMFDVLLFLKSVQQITISTWNDAGSVQGDTYTVTAALSEHDKVARRLFFQNVSKQKDVPVSEINDDNIQYRTVITDTRKNSETWLIHQRIGIKNKEKIPKSVRQAHSFSGLKLIPKGGVAAKLTTTSNIPSHRTRQNFRGKCFCFLPLPIQTNLPVHVDGYFSLGHESRRNLWKAPEGDVRSDWNILIAREVIAPAYVCIMEKMRDDSVPTTPKETDLKELIEVLRHYHSFFPIVYQTEQALHRNVLDEVCQSFYLHIFENTLCLFPVVFANCRSGYVLPRGSNMTLLWKSCTSNAEEKGYFDTLSRQTDDFLQCKSLRRVLWKLHFPILETPLKVLNAMSSFLHDSCKDILSVTPESVIEFLKTDAKETNILELPMELQDTVIGDEICLQIILRYILNFPEVSEVKMNGLPLLLTNDGILREFRTITPVFYSKFSCLLPKCNSEFLHPTLLPILDAKDDCFNELQVKDLVERLSSQLSVEEFCQTDRKMLVQDSSTDPTDEWLKYLWEFLYESYQADNNLDMEQMFGNWCVFPARLNDQTALLPMNLAKSVLSSRTSSYHTQMQDVLTKLNAPVTETNKLWEDGTVCDFVNRFASDTENIPDILIVLERVLKFNKEGFESLRKEDHSSILQYINMQVTQLADGDIEIVRCLPCFETIHDRNVDLSTTAYAVSMENIPNTEHNKWVSLCSEILLKKKSIPGEILSVLDIKELSDIELYGRFILPFFETFTIDAQWDHLNQLMNIVNNADNPDEVINTLKLTSERLIPRQASTPMTANYFRDPENPVYEIMSEDIYIPPNHPNPSKHVLWLQFLRQIGMQTMVSCEQFQGFLISVSEDPQSNDQKEKILVEYLLNNHHLHENRQFLQHVCSIDFITAATVRRELCKLHEQCSKKKVSLSAISVKHCQIVWSTEPLLPTWVELQLSSTCGQCKKPLRKILQVTNEPTMQQVLLHTKKTFRSFSSSGPTESHVQSATVKHKMLPNEIIIAILGFLSKQCQNADVSDQCSEQAKCCENCKTIVRTLHDMAIIPMGDGVFFQTSKLTKNLSKDGNDKLFTFIRQIPDMLMPYSKLLYCMGATEQPSLRQYACALEEITRLGSSLSKNPTMYQAAVQAMYSFFLRLTGADVSELSVIPKLYLLSKGKQLVISTNLFYNDEPTFYTRLREFPNPLMKGLTSSRGQIRDVSIEELLEKLGNLKPRLISEHVVEVPVNTNDSQIIHNCQCSRAKQMRKVLSWPSFTEAVKCILHNQEVTDLTDYESTLQNSFRVTCLSKIQTELQMKGKQVIEKSQIDKGVMLNITGDHEATLSLSHDCKDGLIDIQITEAFISFFDIPGGGMGGLSVVFKTKSEKDLIANLSQLGLKTKDSEFETDTPPVPGSNIEEDVICLLLENVLADFSPEEYVGYNKTQSHIEKFVYARIIKRIETDEMIGIAHQFKVKYLIDAGEEMEVDAVWLYRFQRPDDSSSNPRWPYFNADAPPSSGRDVVVYSGDAGEERSADREFTDLDKSKREITEMIEALWKEDEQTRKSGLRRLMRRWHPDKNKAEHKYFAEEMFKHILKEIARLENGIPSGVDSEDDINRWANQNNRNQSHYWRSHRRRNRGRGSRRQQTGHFFTPPSFHRFNQEALMWQKQARVDVNAASQVVEGANYYQWKSSLCFFAAEKAVRAAQLVCGCDIDDDHNIMDAAIKLKDDLDITQEVNQLLGLVEKSSHYPNSKSLYIPHDMFDQEQADAVMNIATVLMEKVDRYVRNSCN